MTRRLSDSPLRRRLLDHPTVEKMYRSIRMPRIPFIMRHDADRRPAAMQIPQQLHHSLAIGRIEIPSRLIGKQDKRLAAERTRHRHTLLLAPR